MTKATGVRRNGLSLKDRERSKQELSSRDESMRTRALRIMQIRGLTHEGMADFLAVNREYFSKWLRGHRDYVACISRDEAMRIIDKLWMFGGMIVERPPLCEPVPDDPLFELTSYYESHLESLRQSRRFEAVDRLGYLVNLAIQAATAPPTVVSRMAANAVAYIADTLEAVAGELRQTDGRLDLQFQPRMLDVIERVDACASAGLKHIDQCPAPCAAAKLIGYRGYCVGTVGLMRQDVNAVEQGLEEIRRAVSTGPIHVDDGHYVNMANLIEPVAEDGDERAERLAQRIADTALAHGPPDCVRDMFVISNMPALRAIWKEHCPAVFRLASVCEENCT